MFRKWRGCYSSIIRRGETRYIDREKKGTEFDVCCTFELRGLFSLKKIPGAASIIRVQSGPVSPSKNPDDSSDSAKSSIAQPGNQQQLKTLLHFCCPKLSSQSTFSSDGGRYCGRASCECDYRACSAVARPSFLEQTLLNIRGIVCKQSQGPYTMAFQAATVRWGTWERIFCSFFT